MKTNYSHAFLVLMLALPLSAGPAFAGNPFTLLQKEAIVIAIAAKNKVSPEKAEDKESEEEKETSEKAEKPEKEDPRSDEKKAEWIEQTLDFGIQEDRLKALKKLPQIKDAGIRAKLVNKLISVMKDEEDPEVLTKALTNLGEMKETAAAPLMIDKLDSYSEDVRTAAAYGIKNVNAVIAKDKLLQKLKEQKFEENSSFADALIQTLAEFKAVELVPIAKESLENPKTSKAIKEEMILAIGKIGSQDTKEILLKMYKDADEDVILRSYAVNSLSKLGIQEVTGDIKQVIKTIDSYDAKKRKKYNTLYLYSIAALAKLGDTEAIPKLINALRSNSTDVRLKAISLIKDFKDKRTIDILKYKMKYDQNTRVQKAAKKALEEMGVDVKEEKK
jgi:HEAT repeat protein